LGRKISSEGSDSIAPTSKKKGVAKEQEVVKMGKKKRENSKPALAASEGREKTETVL